MRGKLFAVIVALVLQPTTSEDLVATDHVVQPHPLHRTPTDHWSQGLALILGEQKCGTSYLHSLLVRHPQIGEASHPEVGRRKEHHFWNSKLSDPVEARVAKYRKRFRGATVGLDSTPDYFDSVIARDRIKRYAPHAKMIIVLRDPGTRAMSAWDQNRRAGWETRPFEEAIREELEYLNATCGSITNQSQMYRNEEYFWTPEEKSRFDLKPQMPATCLGPRCWLSDHSVQNADGETIEGYRRTAPLSDGSRVYGGCRHYLPAGVYVDKLIKFVRMFPKHQLMVVQSEHFWSQPTQVVARIFEFLGIEPLKDLNAGTTSCWHDCDVPSAPFTVTPAAAASLDLFYAPAKAKLLEYMQAFQGYRLNVVPQNPMQTWADVKGLEVSDTAHSNVALSSGTKVIKVGSWYQKISVDGVKPPAANTGRVGDAHTESAQPGFDIQTLADLERMHGLEHEVTQLNTMLDRALAYGVKQTNLLGEANELNELLSEETNDSTSAYVPLFGGLVLGLVAAMLSLERLHQVKTSLKTWLTKGRGPKGRGT